MNNQQQNKNESNVNQSNMNNGNKSRSSSRKSGTKNGNNTKKFSNNKHNNNNNNNGKNYVNAASKNKTLITPVIKEEQAKKNKTTSLLAFATPKLTPVYTTSLITFIVECNDILNSTEEWDQQENEKVNVYVPLCSTLKDINVKGVLSSLEDGSVCLSDEMVKKLANLDITMQHEGESQAVLEGEKHLKNHSLIKQVINEFREKSKISKEDIDEIHSNITVITSMIHQNDQKTESFLNEIFTALQNLTTKVDAMSDHILNRESEESESESESSDEEEKTITHTRKKTTRTELSSHINSPVLREAAKTLKKSRPTSTKKSKAIKNPSLIASNNTNGSSESSSDSSDDYNYSSSKSPITSGLANKEDGKMTGVDYFKVTEKQQQQESIEREMNKKSTSTSDSTESGFSKSKRSKRTSHLFNPNDGGQNDKSGN